MGYYKNHNRFAAADDKNSPWPIHENTAMCGTTWYQAINQPALGDAWNILGMHFVTTKLNEANLGSVPQSIADKLFQAQTLLASCSVSDADRESALELKDDIERFNESGCEVE
jgi:hypothetical protein